MAQHTIYFDFDKADIRQESREIISAHAHNLAAHAELKVRLEGNTDERGSREYNIGLGERRAQSVREALIAMGANAQNIQTVSFGAEMPADPASNEEAWVKNRRAEIGVVK